MVVKTSSKTGEPIIQLRDLVNRFGTHTVHQALNLDVYRGEILGIVGGSGTGKSVLLRSLVGLQRPAAGDVHVMGKNLRQLDATHRSQIERRSGVLRSEEHKSELRSLTRLLYAFFRLKPKKTLITT